MSGPDYLLAIDQGTTSTRAILFDAAGAVHHTARIELNQIYPRPGWVEHDPEEIWRAVVATCREAIAAAGKRPIAAIGITNQRETTVLWERATGRPVHNAIVWQDRRTAEICETWRDAGFADTVAARTGLVIDPYFSASKIRWLFDARPGLVERARAGDILFGTIDSFLLWRLTAGHLHATDVTNASRTMLFDLRRLAWDDELLGAFDILCSVAARAARQHERFPAPPIPGSSALQSRSPGSPATSRRQRSARPASARAWSKSTYGTGAFALIHHTESRARRSSRATGC